MQPKHYLRASTEVEERRRQSVRTAFLTESQYLTDRANDALARADYVSAAAHAIAALPNTTVPMRPHFPLAEHVLWRALFEPSVTAVSRGKVDGLVVHPFTNEVLSISQGVLTARTMIAPNEFTVRDSCTCEASSITGCFRDLSIVVRRPDSSFAIIANDLCKVRELYRPSDRLLFDAVLKVEQELVVVCVDTNHRRYVETITNDPTEGDKSKTLWLDEIPTSKKEKVAAQDRSGDGRYAVSEKGNTLLVGDGMQLSVYRLKCATRISKCQLPGWNSSLCEAIPQQNGSLVIATKGRLGLRLFTNYRSNVAIVSSQGALEELYEIEGEIRSMAMNAAKTMLVYILDGDKVVVVDLLSRAEVYRRTVAFEALTCGFLEDDRYLFVATPLTILCRTNESYFKQLAADDVVVERVVSVGNEQSEAIVFSASTPAGHAGLYAWRIGNPQRVARHADGSPSGAVPRIVTNRDGSRLACVSEAGAIHLVDLQSDVVAREIACAANDVVDIGFNLKSTAMLIETKLNGVIHVDLATGSTVDHGVLDNADGDVDKAVANGVGSFKSGDGIFSLANKLVTRTSNSGRFATVVAHSGHSISNAGDLLFVGRKARSECLGSVWSLRNGQKKFDIAPLGGFYSSIYSCFSPDGRYLGVGCEEYEPQDGIWFAWMGIVDTGSGQLIDTENVSKETTEVRVSFSSDGKRWAFIKNRFNDPRQDSKIVVKETGRSRALSEVTLVNTSVDRVRFLPNERYVLVRDFSSQCALLVDIIDGVTVAELPRQHLGTKDMFIVDRGRAVVSTDYDGHFEKYPLFGSTDEMIEAALAAMAYPSAMLAKRGVTGRVME